ncbi:transposase [Massilia sp. P8910]|uniref:transposase n=1 Tax=Massilia antarctica TaxID=2765360 RepID=UPI001E2BFFF6|nr:transposase [Massilia antarctica]MCE3608437.1 transposase [Massilia antarctica]
MSLLPDPSAPGLKPGHKLNCAHKFDYGYKNSTSHQISEAVPTPTDSTEFNGEVVARSLVEGTSVSRVARGFNINASQVFTWRRQFADLHGAVNAAPAALVPVTVLNSSDVAAEPALPASGVILLTVGRAQLRIEGDVDAAALAQVLARLLP